MAGLMVATISMASPSVKRRKVTLAGERRASTLNFGRLFMLPITSGKKYDNNFGARSRAPRLVIGQFHTSLPTYVAEFRR